MYGYAGGDPVNFSDPFGLCPICGVADFVASIKLPYSTGGDISALSNEARGSLIATGMRLGVRLGVSATRKVSGDPRHASGHAVDINEIDGVDIGSKGSVHSIETMLMANSVAEGFLENPDVRAVIWPTGYVKSETYGGRRNPLPASFLKQWYDHQDHLHVSFYGRSERPRQ